jgi:nicotinate-nucleotide adenylyltransferase
MHSRSIGIFGGSFDPFHKGHLSLLESVQKRFQFKKILIIPTYQSPNKEPSIFTNQQRIEIIRRAIDGNTRLVVDETEISKKEPSYTYKTMLKLYEDHSNTKFFLIIGEDVWLSRSTWYRIQDLERLTKFIIVGRPNYNAIDLRKIDTNIMNETQAEMSHITYHQSEMHDVSSTQIKKLLLKGYDISNCVVPTTMDLVVRFFNQNK